MSRFKILYLQSTSEISGTDTTLLRYLNTLDRDRFEPHVVLSEHGPLAQEYQKLDCKVHFSPSMRQLSSRRGLGYLFSYVFGYLPAIRDIQKIAEKEKIDLIHTNTIHNLYGFLAARWSRKPHVWHVREIVVQSRLARMIEVFLVKKFSTRFIVMNDAIAEAFTGSCGKLPVNGIKLYDGLDLKDFHPEHSGKRIRQELGISGSALLVGSVCRLDPWKGLDLFLEAAKIVADQESRALFLVCGGEIKGRAGYEAKLKEKAKTLGILDKIYFTGWRYQLHDIPEVYGALDVSVQCPVYPEPYGLANVEAMACGVPIVAAAEGGPLELCGDGESAILVPPHSPEKTAEAILALLKDPEKAEKMGQAGRKRAEALFDRKQCVRDLESIYEEIFNKPH